jgi:hypothetical protein
VAYDPDFIGYDCPNHWVAGARQHDAALCCFVLVNARALYPAGHIWHLLGTGSLSMCVWMRPIKYWAPQPPCMYRTASMRAALTSRHVCCETHQHSQHHHLHPGALLISLPLLLLLLLLSLLALLHLLLCLSLLLPFPLLLFRHGHGHQPVLQVAGLCSCAEARGHPAGNTAVRQPAAGQQPASWGCAFSQQQAACSALCRSRHP